MDLTDLPMVFFTVVSQMAVGAFIVLGVIQVFARRGHSAQTAERVVAPVLYAIGPVLVLGLIVSMFHMHDVTHTFNVIRNWGSSWLSREIIFGCSFAAFGFGFALLEWFGKGSVAFRHAIAAVAALLGVGLLVSESMIYYSLVAVPAWHSWAVPFQFCATALLLGSLGVAAALMVTTLVRLRAVARVTATADEAGSPAVDEPQTPAAHGPMASLMARVAEINAPTSDEEWRLTSTVIKGTALAGAVVAIAILVAYPVYLGGLAQQGGASAEAAAVFSGGLFWSRLVLAALTAILLGFFVFRMAGQATRQHTTTLVVLVLTAFALSAIGEFLARLLHYAAMVKIGL